MFLRSFWYRTVFLHALLLATVCLTVNADETMSRLFRPIRPGRNTFTLADALWTDAVGVDGDDIALQRYRLAWVESRAASNRREWFYSLSYEGFNIDGQLRLPDTGVEVAGLLQDLELGLGSRCARGEDIYGWFANLGSASDEPFDSYDEVSIMANAFYKLTRNRTGSWMFLVNYSNRRSFLTNIPIPGAAYIYTPDRRTLVIAGMPFMLLRYPLTESTDISARYFVPDQVRVESSSRIGGGVSLLAGIDRSEESFFLANREDAEHSLYYEETRIFGGPNWKSPRGTTISLTAGYSVDRRFYQGKNDDGRDRVDIEDAADLRIAVSHRF